MSMEEVFRQSFMGSIGGVTVVLAWIRGPAIHHRLEVRHETVRQHLVGGGSEVSREL
jgi:hypothetical protein